MKQTENYGFNVPEEHEFYDVAAQNENWEKLDFNTNRESAAGNCRSKTVTEP